jgi:hypothetical protein
LRRFGCLLKNEVVQRKKQHQTDHKQQDDQNTLGVPDVWNSVQVPTMRALDQPLFTQRPRLNYIGRSTFFADVRMAGLVIRFHHLIEKFSAGNLCS